MRQEWQLWANDNVLLDPASCAEIVEAAMKLPEQDAGVGGHNSVTETIRRSKVRWIPRNDRAFKDLHDFVYDRIERSNRNAFGFDIAYYPALQFTCYSSVDSGFYDWHMDTFLLLTESQGTRMMDRKLSMVLQLSNPDDYEGGDLEIDGTPIPKDELRKQGAMVVFPSFLRHRVTPVTRGVRYSLVLWAEGPFWR